MIINFAERINDKLRKEKVTKADLSRFLKGKVAQRTIYDFLAGKTAINSSSLAEILDACGFFLCEESNGAFTPHVPLLKHKWRAYI